MSVWDRLTALASLEEYFNNTPTHSITDFRNSAVSDENASSLYANITDRLIEKVFAAALPMSSSDRELGLRLRRQKDRPPFSLQLSSKNFRLMTSRQTVMFEVYYAMVEFATWKNPALTLSVMSLYTHICIYPRLLAALAPAAFLSGVMVPAYAARHPPEPIELESNPAVAVGPPLRQPGIPKPVPDFSREFFLNVVDTQNLMSDYTAMYDAVTIPMAALAYFVDERRSSLVYICVLCSGIIAYAVAPIVYRVVPWPIVFIISGWVAILTPQLKPKSAETVLDEEEDSTGAAGAASEPVFAQLDRVIKRMDTIAHAEFSIDQELEQHQVEAFELQRYDAHTNQWGPSRFVGGPFRIPVHLTQVEPPAGSVSIEGVQPPNEWQFLAKSKWELDFFPAYWVSLHQLELQTEVDDKIKWVYDFDKGRRANWRRRRYVRTCVRRRDEDA